MNSIFTAFISLAFAAQTAVSAVGINANAVNSTDSKSTSTIWQQLYSDKLKEYMASHTNTNSNNIPMFDLYDIDNDGTPELFISDSNWYHGAYCTVFSTADETVNELIKFRRYGTVDFIKNTLLLDDSCNNGHSYKSLYKKEGNKLECVFNAYTATNGQFTHKFLGQEDADYILNEKESNKEEYEKELAKFYNSSYEVITLGRAYEITNENINSVLLGDTANGSSDECWKELYNNKLYSLIDEGWTMQDNSSNNGSRFDFYDIDNNGTPELFVTHDNGQVGEGLLISVINGELIQSKIWTRYGSIMANSEYSVVTCNTGTPLLPYIYVGKYDNGIVTEIFEGDEGYSDYIAIENWDSVGYKYSFDSESIETALKEIDDVYQDDNETVYDEFGVSNADLENSAVKPKLTVSKIVVPEDEASNIQRVEISVSGADKKFCSTELHVYYDERLSIPQQDNGRYNIECSQDELGIKTFKCNPEMSSITLATGGTGDFGNDGVMWTIDFILPDDATAGDVYPIDIDWSYADGKLDSLFTDYDYSESGKLMNAYTFIKGIYNKYNPYEGDEYLPAGSTYDGYIAVATNETSDIIYGDANCDGKVEIADATLILQFLTNKDEYSLTDQGLINADVSGNNDGVTAQDALVIQQVDAGIYKTEDLPI